MSVTTHRGLRLALASLLAVALVAQLLIGLSNSDLTVARFFSYFTVLSNLGAVVVLTMLAARPGRDDSAGFATFRGAVTVYMGVTGIVYATVLYPQLADVGVPEPWIDISIHVLGPLALALDWIFYRPSVRLPRHTVWTWLVFPCVWLVYTLMRGPIADWYPYPFLDPATGGYGSVVLWSLFVLVVILAVGYISLWWVNRSQPVSEPEGEPEPEVEPESEAETEPAVVGRRSAGDEEE